MPAYLVELPQPYRVEGVNALSVFAADETGARQAAEGQFDGDASALWSTLATVTEIVAGVDLADAGKGWSGYCRVRGAAGQTAGFDPFIAEADGNDRNLAQGRLGRNRKHLSESSITINDGGTGYSVDEIITLGGGTLDANAGRAATFRVTSVSTGVIDGLELVDPGEYTELPNLTATTDTTNSGSGNDDVDLTLAQADEGSYEAIMAQMVTELLGSPDIAGASVDMSEGGSGARLLTVATGSGGDDLGDATVEFEYRQNGTAFDPLVGTITDEGLATAALTVAIPASPLAPARVSRFQERVVG